ncbi:DUF3237 domain-containing protein [Parasphingopyxis marina]|uniref:DUF3237 domain-containing protein n=1 Tax=Parasphingopyxis marina TaxID=2761622 RepID=A0A842HWW4_9SPHN|nr:DUF3237 domain-containing protein [Parasphingopyxis marina]MBC2776004.1 DUF3237 domain-containing protein [Parasphingopyxis marina]
MSDNDPQVPAGLEYVFEMKVFFRPERCIFGPLPGGGHKGYTPCSSGEIYGPRLSGKIVPDSGADFADVRGDGVVVVKSHYMLEADDGTKIYINNNGYLVPGKEGVDEVVDGVLQPGYFKFSPTFVVPEGPHDWMGKTLIVGAGRRCTNPDHSIFTYYAVT